MRSELMSNAKIEELKVHLVTLFIERENKYLQFHGFHLFSANASRLCDNCACCAYSENIAMNMVFKMMAKLLTQNIHGC